MDAVDKAAEQLITLAGGDPEMAEALFELDEEDRRQRMWVKYWEPCGDEVKFWTEKVYLRKTWVVLGGNRCIGAGTQVATPAGPRAIERITPGECVYAADGTIAHVIRRFENGEKDFGGGMVKRSDGNFHLTQPATIKFLLPLKRTTLPN